MKIVIISYLFFFTSNILNAQSLVWTWANGAGGTGQDASYAVNSDTSGNIYITGSFSSPSITFGNSTLTQLFGGDCFIAKYDNNGNALWAKSARGTSYETGNGIAIDNMGNVFVTGMFVSPSIMFGNITLPVTGGNDVFVVKHDPSGNVLWAKNAIGSSDEVGTDINVDAQGNAYVTGYSRSTILVFDGDTLTSSGGIDCFITKYDPAGNVVWAKNIGDSGDDIGNSICTDSIGNSYIAGSISSDTLIAGSDTLIVNGGTDAFIIKHDPSGNVVWAKSLGGEDDDLFSGISSKNGDFISVSGHFTSDSLVLADTVLMNNGSNDILVSRLDTSGNIQWIKCAGSSLDDFGSGVSEDPDGNTILTGYYFGNTIIFETDTLTTNGAADVFAVKYDSSGNEIWIESFGGSAADNSMGVCTDANGNVLVTGYYQSSTIAIGTTTLTSAGTLDIYVAKLEYVTGIEETNIIQHEINLFPNPTNGEINIATKEIIDEVKIYNSFGQLIYQTKEESKNLLFKPENNGLFFIQIKTGNTILTKKIEVFR